VRRNLGYVLVGLAGLLLTVAVLAVVWAPDEVKRTPLDVDSHTVYEGQAAKIDPATNEFVEKPVYAIQDTKADSARSSDDHILFVETSCLVVDTGGDRVCVDGDNPNLVTADVDVFATDRRSGLGVADKNLPAGTVVHEGLNNKWPFDVQKKTYPYWDGLLGRPIDMVYDGEEKIQGLDTYRFKATVQDEPVEVAEGIPGTYSNVITVNVDPGTGAIVKGGQDQQRYLDDGTQVLDVDIVWTAETIQDAVDDAKANNSKLTLVLTVVPIVGFAVGGLFLLAGLFLVMRGNRPATRTAAPAGSGGPTRQPAAAS
jgi:hypothetical protein